MSIEYTIAYCTFAHIKFLGDKSFAIHYLRTMFNFGSNTIVRKHLQNIFLEYDTYDTITINLLNVIIKLF